MVDGRDPPNPVLATAEVAHEATNLVQLNPKGIESAAKLIHEQMLIQSYSPATWREHPLHLVPRLPYSSSDPSTKATLDWIFLVSTLNFSFWSEFDCESEKYAVNWKHGWNQDGVKSWTGYWSLLAALNKTLEAKIPITDPKFYSCKLACPDALIINMFHPSPGSKECMPLLEERIAAMREAGSILCERFHGSFKGLLIEFEKRHSGYGTALQLVQMVVENFPCFRDETQLEGKTIYFWKRAQILVAETWAAFYPETDDTPHPFFPQGISQLTMFADYRVPQILRHLDIITYPPVLEELLKSGTYLPNGSREEISIRACSILAVERIKEQILSIRAREGYVDVRTETIPSVLIDFFLWDMAKELESGTASLGPSLTNGLPPAHRTRCIWY